MCRGDNQVSRRYGCIVGWLNRHLQCHVGKVRGPRGGRFWSRFLMWARITMDVFPTFSLSEHSQVGSTNDLGPAESLAEALEATTRVASGTECHRRLGSSTRRFRWKHDLSSIFLKESQTEHGRGGAPAQQAGHEGALGLGVRVSELPWLGWTELIWFRREVRVFAVSVPVAARGQG
jgi:hypothetical protein